MPWATIAAAAIPIVYDMLTESNAERAAGAQTGLLQQQSALMNSLMSMYNQDPSAWQSEELKAALGENQSLFGLAPGFARRELVSKMLGIGQPGLNSLAATQVEDEGYGQAAAQLAQIIAAWQANKRTDLDQKSDPGSGDPYYTRDFYTKR